MIRRGRREEKTETKRDRKSIIAENPKPTKHYKNIGFRQLSRTPRQEHRKQSILEKAATQLVFGAETKCTTNPVVSSVFFRKQKTRIRCPRKASPENVPFFILPGAKLSKGLFGANPILTEKVRFEKPLRPKTLFLPRNFEKGLKNRRKNREERHK